MSMVMRVAENTKWFLLMNIDLLKSKKFFFFKQKTAYEIRNCDWSSDVCSSDLKRKFPLMRFAREANSRSRRKVRSYVELRTHGK